MCDETQEQFDLVLYCTFVLELQISKWLMMDTEMHSVLNCCTRAGSIDLMPLKRFCVCVVVGL